MAPLKLFSEYFLQICRIAVGMRLLGGNGHHPPSAQIWLIYGPRGCKNLPICIWCCTARFVPPAHVVVVGWWAEI
jgi:hypothetical protein